MINKINPPHINAKLIFWLSLIIIISSCEKVVYLDVDTKENRLVVNSFIEPDTTIFMTVSLSTDPLAVGFDNVRINDAAIRLYKNENHIADFNLLGDGTYFIYKDDVNAAPGDKFRIEADAPGKESIVAETEIPSQINIDKAEIIDTIFVKLSYSTIDSLGNIVFIDTLVPHYQLQITFTDPDGEDFYSLKINYQDAFSETYTCFTTDDPVFSAGDYGFGDGNEEGAVTLCDEVFFSDITFNGKKKTITLSLLEIPTEFALDPRFILRLNHLSESYYKYIASADLQSGSGDNPFGEPVIVYSNIEHGFGIFAGFSSATARIDL